MMFLEFNYWRHLTTTVSKFSDSIYLSKLRKLKSLNLSYNDFDMKTLRYLGSLSALTSLDLRSNQLVGQLSKEGM